MIFLLLKHRSRTRCYYPTTRWNSSADPVHGATGFRDAGGYYYPNGKEGEPHLQDFNNPDSKYFDPVKYDDIVTKQTNMEGFRGVICQGQYCSPLYSYSTSSFTMLEEWTFTVFHGPTK